MKGLSPEHSPRSSQLVRFCSVCSTRCVDLKAIPTILLVASIAIAARLMAEQRVFTSNDGKAITAELVSATKDQATLKLENGQETVLPITRFGDAWPKDSSVIGQRRILSPCIMTSH